MWLVLLHLLRLQSKALPLQPSSPPPSAVPGRPSPPRVPPSFALQLPAMGALSSSALLQRVADRNKAQQFAALMSTKLPGKRYRLLYTWSRDGRSNASFHQRCDNQVPAIARDFRLQSVCVTL